MCPTSDEASLESSAKTVARHLKKEAPVRN